MQIEYFSIIRTTLIKNLFADEVYKIDFFKFTKLDNATLGIFLCVCSFLSPNIWLLHRILDS